MEISVHFNSSIAIKTAFLHPNAPKTDRFGGFDFKKVEEKLTSLRRSKEASKKDWNREGGDEQNPRTGVRWWREGARVAAGPETHELIVRCREFHGFFFVMRLQMIMAMVACDTDTRTEMEKSEISKITKKSAEAEHEMAWSEKREVISVGPVLNLVWMKRDSVGIMFGKRREDKDLGEK